MNQNANKVFYEIHVPTFYDSDADGVGDLLGIVEKLPYIASLGVDAICLTSFLETTNANTFYEVSDYCRVNPQIGESEDLVELLSKAHELGLSVFLSFPVSCTSDGHNWFEKGKSATSSYRQYYVRSSGKGKSGSNPPDKIKNRLGESRWAEDGIGGFYRNTFGISSPDLDLNDPLVRKEFCQIALYWKKFGADGLVLSSLDFSIEKIAIKAGKMLYNPSASLYSEGKENYTLLKEIRESVGEDFYIALRGGKADEIAACYLTKGKNPPVNAVFFSDMTEHSLFPVEKSVSLKKIVKQYANALSSALFENRIISLEDPMHARFLSSFDGFDSEEKYYYAAKTLAAMLLSAPGFVWLFQGEEIAMSNLVFRQSVLPSEKANPEDLDLKPDYVPEKSDPFQWDNKRHAGFTEADFPITPVCDNYVKINATIQENDPQSVLNFYKKMIEYRKAEPCLSLGDFHAYTKGNPLISAFTRSEGDDSILVIASLSDENVNYTLPEEIAKRGGKCEFGNYKLCSKFLHETVGLRPFETRIYKLNPLKKMISDH